MAEMLLLYVGKDAAHLSRHFYRLARDGWQIEQITSQRAARQRVADACVALVDANLPRLHDPARFCRRLRYYNPACPVFLLAPAGGERLPLDVDVLTLPCTPHKLARTVAGAVQATVLEAAGLRLDLTTRRVVAGADWPLPLPPKECELLKYLMENAGRAVSRTEIMRHVWRTRYTLDTRTLDVHIRWLRQKIEAGARWHRCRRLLTVRGVGYMLAAGTQETVGNGAR